MYWCQSLPGLLAQGLLLPRIPRRGVAGGKEKSITALDS
jgi:hypothetical protein